MGCKNPFLKQNIMKAFLELPICKERYLKSPTTEMVGNVLAGYLRNEYTDIGEDRNNYRASATLSYRIMNVLSLCRCLLICLRISYMII